MGKYHGSLARLYIRGYDFSSAFVELTSVAECQSVESSGFGDTGEDFTFDPRLMSRLSGQGHVDAADGETLSHDVLDALKGVQDGSHVIHMFRDTTLGDPGVVIAGTIPKHEVSMPHREVAACQIEAISNNGYLPVESLAPKGSVTEDTDGSRLDNTVATDNGFESFLQVFAIEGTDPEVTIKVQEDDNDDSWADQVTHTVVTAAGVTAGYQDRQSATGTIQRGLRYSLAVTSGSLTSITFALVVCRKP